MKVKISTKISIGTACIIAELFIMGFVSLFPAHGQTRKLSEDEMGAIIWGRGKEIKGEIHIGEPIAHQSNLWVVTSPRQKRLRYSPPGSKTAKAA